MTWSGRFTAEGGAVCFWVARPVVAEGGQRHGCFERTLEAALASGFLVIHIIYVSSENRFQGLLQRQFEAAPLTKSPSQLQNVFKSFQSLWLLPKP